jgi:hypothetical protein
MSISDLRAGVQPAANYNPQQYQSALIPAPPMRTADDCLPRRRVTSAEPIGSPADAVPSRHRRRCGDNDSLFEFALARHAHVYA